MATLTDHKPHKSARTRTARADAAPGGAIRVWEDDPSSGIEATIGRPDPAAAPLAYDFVDGTPEPDEDTATFAFRFWTAVASLRRGADFWAPQVPGGAWQRGPVLPVILDDGEDLNAFYDRQALHFFHGRGADGATVFSGASPDILLHEMGHAILDSLKPQLFDVASQEAAAFHESFGDMSAILGALQLPSLREAILEDTGGRISRNSRLSRLAEELGAAIRAESPGAVDPDCLRNAANSFSYADPSTLPSRAPASQLSSEAHSFSRVFTGAFLDGLAAMLRVRAADADAPTPDELAEVSLHMRDILVVAIENAPVVSNFMSQIAAGMVMASGSVDGDYPPVLRESFTRRSILSLQTSMLAMSKPAATFAMSASAAPAAMRDATLDKVALPAAHYGLDEPLTVVTPSSPRRMLATAARTDATPAEPSSAVSAATQFVDDLFAQGRVETPGMDRARGLAARSPRLKTHRVVRDDGALTLKRILFDCGCGCHGKGS